MTLRALLGKELRWGRRRWATLLLLLVVLPAAFAYTSMLFQSVLPKTAPVAVVAGGPGVTAEDLNVATKALRVFAHPVHYDSRAAAFEALDREQVYGVLVVPPELAGGGGGKVTVPFYVDGRVVPYREPSQAVSAALQRTLSRGLEANVDVDHRLRGPTLVLSEYLLPTFLFALLGVLAFAYLPYNLASESGALDRVRVESSLESYLAAKLLFFTGLALVPVGVFAAAGRALGYEATVLAPTAVAVYLLSFLAFAGVSSAVTFLTGFSTVGRLLNVLVLFLVLTFSGLAYPAGFFSPVRREVIRRFPTHYAVVLVRNATLKDLGAATYPLAAAVVVATAAGGLLLAEAALVRYRRAH